MFTFDEIRIDIFHQDLVLTINEEMEGWNLFVQKINSVFPNVPQNWDSEIIKPAFATNTIVLFSK